MLLFVVVEKVFTSFQAAARKVKCSRIAGQCRESEIASGAIANAGCLPPCAASVPLPAFTRGAGYVFLPLRPR